MIATTLSVLGVIAMAFFFIGLVFMVTPLFVRAYYVYDAWLDEWLDEKWPESKDWWR